VEGRVDRERGLGITYLKEEAMKSPIVLLLSLLTDVGRLEPDVKGLDRDVITVKSRVEHEGYGFLTIVLPSLCDALDRGLASGQFACPLGLKKVRGGAIPRMFSGMLCKVFDSVTGCLLEAPSVGVLKCLREVLRFCKKLDLSSDQETFLDLKAKTEFFANDELCLSENKFSEREFFILNSVCKTILPNIDNFDERELPCKHGPGAVREGLKTNQKWLAIATYSSRLEELGYDVNYLRDEMEGTIVDSSEPSPYGASGDSAKLITVSKNSTSRRTITVEPVVRQFVQQGFNILLRDSISHCSILSRCLALTDQSKNQILALEGSRTGYWSTIDLKSASDLLSVKIVEIVFRNHPNLLEGLLDCRSPKCSSGEDQFTLRKYAGMGNATTFPVQSIVFAVLAMAALLEGKRPTFGNIKRVSRLVRVYGDDIIVPTTSVHQVVAWIHKAGLIVNLKKTFSTGNFRESCGVDAFCGYNVTPLYLRHCPDETSKEPSTIAHLVSLSNQAWLRGLYSLSTSLVQIAEDSLRRRLPLVHSSCGLLGLHTHLNVQEFQRWNPILHRPETIGPMLVSLKRRDKLDGYAALLKFFHTPLLGRAVGHLEKSPVRFKSKIVPRWVPG
jgi:hypothetical protein